MFLFMKDIVGFIIMDKRNARIVASALRVDKYGLVYNMIVCIDLSKAIINAQSYGQNCGVLLMLGVF